MFVFGKYRYGIHNTSGKQVIVILEKHTKIEIEIFFFQILFCTAQDCHSRKKDRCCHSANSARRVRDFNSRKTPCHITSRRTLTLRNFFASVKTTTNKNI